ncbi:hypothetical protein [Piscinibacter sp. XHJ-5]|uniref:hypothetical protein n=1 Tax=Piscinibacter sp. XHJ-5 TaxID=3037797 RepID=UPI002453508F|nr:hypothetical protein [Piscinibacter sp. XHJ-5]
MRDTETRLGAEIRALLARHRVLESALLDTLKALPREDAARLAQELRSCANEDPATIPPLCGPEIRPWSFLRRDAAGKPPTTR